MTELEIIDRTIESIKMFTTVEVKHDYPMLKTRVIIGTHTETFSGREHVTRTLDYLMGVLLGVTIGMEHMIGDVKKLRNDIKWY
jgi:hypothetical protein